MERLERRTEFSFASYDAQEADTRGRGYRVARRTARRRASQLLRRTVAERRAMADFEAAMSRLELGRFGWCDQCGGVAAAGPAEVRQAICCAACDLAASG